MTCRLRRIAVAGLLGLGATSGEASAQHGPFLGRRHVGRGLGPSASVIHEQKQWSSTRPEAQAGSIEFTLMVWTSPARHLAQ